MFPRSGVGALVRAMDAGETVDGLVVCSVYEKDARTLSVTRCRTSDGHETTDEGDAGVDVFAALSGDPRLRLGARTSRRGAVS